MEISKGVRFVEDEDQLKPRVLQKLASIINNLGMSKFMTQ